MIAHPELPEPEKLQIIAECSRDGVAVVMLYLSKEGPKARAVLVDKLDVNKRGQWYCSGVDSLSKEYRSFTVGQIACLHRLDYGVPPTVIEEEESDDSNWNRMMNGEPIPTPAPAINWSFAEGRGNGW